MLVVLVGCSLWVVASLRLGYVKCCHGLFGGSCSLILCMTLSSPAGASDTKWSIVEGRTRYHRGQHRLPQDNRMRCDQGVYVAGILASHGSHNNPGRGDIPRSNGYRVTPENVKKMGTRNESTWTSQSKLNTRSQFRLATHGLYPGWSKWLMSFPARTHMSTPQHLPQPGHGSPAHMLSHPASG